MRWLWIILTVSLAFLQYKLWWGPGGIHQILQIQDRVQRQGLTNAFWTQKNKRLTADIEDLKHNKESLEEYARYRMGMIGGGEVFYRFIDQ